MLFFFLYQKIMTKDLYNDFVPSLVQLFQLVHLFKDSKLIEKRLQKRHSCFPTQRSNWGQPVWFKHTYAFRD